MTAVAGLQGDSLMQPHAPKCPYGYVDSTGGNAFWWRCAKNCPGKWPSADADCGCACVLPSVYAQMLIDRAAEARAAASGRPSPAPAPANAPPAPSAPAAPLPTPPGWSAPAPEGWSPGAPASAPVASPAPSVPAAAAPAPAAIRPQPVETEVRATVAPALDGSWMFASTSTVAPAVPPEEGLSGTAIFVIASSVAAACIVCILSATVCVRASPDVPVEKQPMAVKTLLRCAQATSGISWPRKTKKISRVAPEPEIAIDSQEDPLAAQTDKIAQWPLTHDNLLFSAAARGTAFPALQFTERQVQPPAQPPRGFSPDVSSVSRQQKEAVLAALPHCQEVMQQKEEAVMNRKRSLTPPKTTTPRPSCGSDQSTRSPSPEPSSARSKHSAAYQSKYGTPRATPRQDIAAFSSNAANALATPPRATPQATPGATPRTTPRTTPQTLPKPSLLREQRDQLRPRSRSPTPR